MAQWNSNCTIAGDTTKHRGSVRAAHRAILGLSICDPENYFIDKFSIAWFVDGMQNRPLNDKAINAFFLIAASFSSTK